MAYFLITEKDLGFLRIGSLNVRVKRTTEAFSNFLGVGQQNTEKIHKNWGSADNVQQVRIGHFSDNFKNYPQLKNYPQFKNYFMTCRVIEE